MAEILLKLVLNINQSVNHVIIVYYSSFFTDSILHKFLIG